MFLHIKSSDYISMLSRYCYDPLAVPPLQFRPSFTSQAAISEPSSTEYRNCCSQYFQKFQQNLFIYLSIIFLYTNIYIIYLKNTVKLPGIRNLVFPQFLPGTVGLVFSAFGILISGLVISKYKPRARYLAAWNVIVGIISVLGIISYAFLGCPASDNHGVLALNDE